MASKNKKLCVECAKTLSKNEIGLSMKMLGRNIESFFCLACLAAYLEVEVDDLKQKILEFKAQGCTLFI